MHFFEEYHMDERVTYALKEEQLGGVETLMWVVVWILVCSEVQAHGRDYLKLI